MFDSVKDVYQEAIEKSGYDFELKYSPSIENPQSFRSNRRRKEIWFNPPFSTGVKTRIGARFLKLVDQHFLKITP